MPRDTHTHEDTDGEPRRGGNRRHHHGVDGRPSAPADFGTAFAIGITVNLAFVVGEAFYGVVAHSLALLADAGHNLSDVLGLGGAWLAAVLGRRRPAGRFTYGLRGSSILAALGNAVVLLLVTGGIAAEALQRLLNPEPSGGRVITVVALIGILVSGFTALLFFRGRNNDLNIRGAFLHMASDALVALGVAVAGLLIMATGWSWLDPAVSLAVSAIILVGTWGLLRDATSLALDAVPPGVDHAGVTHYLRSLPGVREVHDLHIWGMSTTETALTAHLLRPDALIDDDMLHDAGEALRERFGITHVTLQVENGHGRRTCGLQPSDVV